MFVESAQINTLSYFVAQQVPSSNRVSLPVSSTQFIYSQFEHVQGIASKEGGVSISKLQILNSLIDHIIQKKSTASSEKLKAENLDEVQLEKLISKIQTKIQKQDILSAEIPYIKVIEDSKFFDIKV